MDKKMTAQIACVGAGWHASESLFPNIPQIPEFELVAICDLLEERASYHAHKYGVQAFTNAEEMLDRLHPQGVVVCGPPDMHHKVGLQVLERGIPAFLEKPLGSTSQQANELVNTALKSKTWGMVGFMKRFAPANQLVKDFMSHSEYGRLSSITLIHGCGPYEAMRKMLIYNGIHMLDLGRFLAGDEVDELFAYGYCDRQNVQAVSVVMKFHNRIVGQLNMNSGQTWKDCQELVYLSGAGAGIWIKNSSSVEVMSPCGQFAQGTGLELFGWSNSYYASGNMAGWYASGHYTRGYWGELSHFAKAIIGQVEPKATLQDGLVDMVLIDKILDSIETGQPQKVCV